MHKTIVFVLGILQKYLAQNPFTSTVIKVQYDETDGVDIDPEIAFFYQIVEKIKKAKEDQGYGVTLNGIKIDINTLD